uniref:Ubiquitin-like domain-containing protein n=1 Tax=Cyclopterus lumpus TaxID=8103 RepID=A0A8C2X5W0_CYCLU
MKYQLKINGPRGEEKIIDLCENEEDMGRITVHQLKKKIARELKTNRGPKDGFTIFQLEESSLLSSYGIRHMSTIHTLLMLPGGV